MRLAKGLMGKSGLSTIRLTVAIIFRAIWSFYFKTKSLMIFETKCFMKSSIKIYYTNTQTNSNKSTHHLSLVYSLSIWGPSLRLLREWIENCLYIYSQKGRLKTKGEV